MSCLVNPAGGPSSPVDLLPDVAPGGKLGQQSPGVVDLVPDSVLGVISSGIRCARTFCEHLTALYAVECSKNTQEVLREGTGRPPRGRTSGYADELVHGRQPANRRTKGPGHARPHVSGRPFKRAAPKIFCLFEGTMCPQTDTRFRDKSLGH